MANIHIDWATGDDTTGDGSSGTPYKTLSKAFTVVANGDTIKIANTAAQEFTATLAFPAASPTSDAVIIIEGWDNGGSLTIENPSGDFTDVGVLDGTSLSATSLFTGAKGQFLWRRLKFQNFAFSTGNLGASFSSNVFQDCDFVSNSCSTGSILSLGTSSVAMGCSFRNNTVSSTGSVVLASAAQSSVFNCYFYNSKNALIATANSGIFTYNIFDEISGYCMNLSGFCDRLFISNNTFIGDGSASNFGISFTGTSAESNYIFNNHFQDFSGASSSAINNTAVAWPATFGSFHIVGGNSFYNNTNNYEAGGNFAASIVTDLRSLDVQETSEPLEDRAGFDYRKKTTAISWTNQSILGAWNYTETKINLQTGAAQDDIVASGGGGGGGGSGGSYTFS